MKLHNLELYKTIGAIHTSIQNTDNYDDAIKTGLKCILDSGIADYAILWFHNKTKDQLFPFYWVCPIDLSSKRINNGIIYDSFINQNSIFINNYPNNRNLIIDNTLEGIDIDSFQSIPFNDGCLIFIKEKGHGNFNDDELETNNILVMLADMYAKEKKEINISEDNKEKILSIRNLKKSFISGDIQTKVLNDINFDLFKGEFLCVLGESGCGKSTLLNIISGLIKADSGSINFMGKEILDLNEEELTEYRRKNIGFVFQSYNLMPNLTVKENLDLIIENSDESIKAEDALKLVSLEDKINSFPSELSGGQQQRVSIARAIVKKPVILFADEPTAALDYDTSIDVLESLSKIVKKGTTLIMVTHNIEITRTADRIINIRRGKIYDVTINKNPISPRELNW